MEISASLPCYLEDNVEAQRGKGVYATSIEALRQLNALGYGDELVLNLVYNPVGPVLPPPQEKLEADYRRELGARFGIRFNQLLTITNMPISRFGSVLLAQGQYVQYMSLLRDNFSQTNMETLMCRRLLSVDWRGYLYDCDFNQMLDLPLLASDQAPPYQRTAVQRVTGGQPDCHRRALLWLYGGPGQQLWRRIGRLMSAGVSFVIPVLNEQATVSASAADLRAALPRQPTDRGGWW